MMTKRNGLIVSSVLFAIFAVATLFQSTCDYKAQGFCWQYWDQVWTLIEILLITAPLFVISLLVYFLRDEIFRAWFKFAVVWVPLTILLTLMAPEYGQSLLPIEKGGVTFLFSVIFFIVSVIIIVAKRSSPSSSK